jgi:[ribosomal protein S18]-alanine N-acetyltransferase
MRIWLKRKDKSGELVPAPTEPLVQPLGLADLNECWRLDQLCFSDGEAYDRETLRYLLSHTKSSCFKVVTPQNEMLAFIIGMIEPDHTGHVVALGVAAEHRVRGYGYQLMDAIEESFLKNGIRTVRLEVRTTNEPAQRLYFKLGYRIVRRMPSYYTSGDDGYLMVKEF